MAKSALHDCRILVAEDEYFIAHELAAALEEEGAVILGPVPRVQDALSLIAAEGRIDLALLDVNLCGERVYPVAEALMERGIPFVFATGYDGWSLPARFLDIPRIAKPFGPEQLQGALKSLLSAA